MINDFLSVVTITKDDSRGLNSTLNSLSKLQNKPKKIIIINGSPKNRDTLKTIETFKKKLNILAINENDSGIFYAMNKGRDKVETELVHYLNSGDEVFGEPYKNINEPTIMPVVICDHEKKYKWKDKIKFNGYGYCHQGIIFPSNHPKYDTSMVYGADLDLNIKVFKNGLQVLKLIDTGGAIFYLGGHSSIGHKEANQYILSCLKKNFSFFDYYKSYAYIFLKSLLPRKIRRKLITFFSG